MAVIRVAEAIVVARDVLEEQQDAVTARIFDDLATVYARHVFQADAHGTFIREDEDDVPVGRREAAQARFVENRVKVRTASVR